MAPLIPRSTLAGAIGNTVKWFDFAGYGYFAKEIGQAFFPADVPSLQLLSAFAVFAMGLSDAADRRAAAGADRGSGGAARLWRWRGDSAWCWPWACCRGCC